jgi:ribosomal protein S18 acetylase RimI-like enzyme
MAEGADAERVVIRPIVEAELSALEWDGQYTRYRRVFRQTWDDVQRGQRLMLVAVTGGEIVGQIFIQLTSAEMRYADGVSRAYLYSLRVRAEWQGRGLGTRLIEAAEAALRARGFTLAVIAAGKENPRAEQLYRRLGYRTFADDPGVWYFTDVNGIQQLMEEPCWVMEKRLARR